VCFPKQGIADLKRLNQDHLIGLACIIVSGGVFYLTSGFPKASTGASDLTGPSFYPNLLAILFVLCGIYEIAYGFQKVEGRSSIGLTGLLKGVRHPGFLNISLIVLLTVFFILFMNGLGFVVCSWLFLFVSMWRFGVPLLKNILYSILYVLFLLLVFGKIFAIYLPSGVLDFLGL
jgi:putative tricarboxylic transport membrane protein